MDQPQPHHASTIETILANESLTQQYQTLYAQLYEHWRYEPNSSNNRLVTPAEMIAYVLSKDSIDLSHHQFSSIPSLVFDLTSITNLDLSCNRLTGLPSQLFNLNRLESLDLRHNALETLPKEINTLTSLHSLILEANHLTTIPKEIFDLPALANLSLSHNQLTKLPEDIESVEYLINLNLSHNPIKALPNWLFFGLEKIESLYLHHLSISHFPEELFELDTLKLIGLPGRWVGDIDFGKFPHLKYVDVYEEPVDIDALNLHYSRQSVEFNHFD